jgi:hypothetical protein
MITYSLIFWHIYDIYVICIVFCYINVVCFGLLHAYGGGRLDGG